MSKMANEMMSGIRSVRITVVNVFGAPDGEGRDQLSMVFSWITTNDTLVQHVYLTNSNGSYLAPSTISSHR